MEILTNNMGSVPNFMAKIRKLDLLQRFFGTISLGETLEELESSGFRLHKKLKEKLLQEAEGN